MRTVIERTQGMKVAEIFEVLIQSGAEIKLEREKLRIKTPKGRLSSEILNQMDQFKPELVELLEKEVKWRVETMRSQIKPLEPVPLLIVKKNSEKGGLCISCGIPLPLRTQFRCWFCSLASRKILSEIR